jgi:glutamate 5-kinase
VVEQGKSLLPVGVVAVDGEFGKGDVVAVCDETGREVARGLSNYSSADTDRIRGRSREQILSLLGSVPYAELVHRDNLVVTATP